MTAPRSDIYQMRIQNPHAALPLILPVLVLCNTPDDELNANIRANSAKDVPWIGFDPEHDGVAVLVGGGPSAAESVEEIRRMADDGSIVFAMNAAATFLIGQGITPDYQVMADAKPETAQLVEPRAGWNLMASQVHPGTLRRGGRTRLWHLGIENMEDHFPEGRKKRGGYALVGGGAAVGNSALCLAYVMGYRTMHCFGYDSSHRGESSHAYDQPMNKIIPTIETEWAGTRYTSSVAMKAQAEKFQITAQRLKQEGCAITVHGDGLLPAMFNTPAGDLAERDKYRLIWQMDSYRETSLGLHVVGDFLDRCKPAGLIVDFGCGTGVAALAMAQAGHDVVLVDFAENCRDEEALALPFLEWDLTQPCPLSAPHGFCTDVMEHVPTADVPAVIRNIMASAAEVYFQISTVPDQFGALIGKPLHLTVRDADWWAARFDEYEISWRDHDQTACRFVVRRAPSQTGS